MSRSLWAVALVFAVTLSAVAQPPNKGAKAGSPATPAKMVEAKIRQSWQDFKDKKKDAFGAAIADDATEVWVDGKVRDKATAVNDITTFDLNNFSLLNFKLTMLGADAALATYQAKIEGVAGKQKFNMTMNVTDLWVKRGGEWKNLRYHESEAK